MRDENTEIDFSNGFFLIKIDINVPVFKHWYIEDAKLHSRCMRVLTFGNEQHYMDYISNFKVNKNEYLVEYNYNDLKIRKAFVKHPFSTKIPIIDVATFVAKMREEKINDILND